jgi:primosomal protein N' (replication factor Y)
MDKSSDKNGMFAVVTLPLPLSQSYLYSVPEEIRLDVSIGIPVFVPFGKRHLTGYITGFSKECPVGVKPIQEIVDSEPVFSQKLLQLFSWVSRYYLTPLGLVIKTSIPSRLSIKEKILVHAYREHEEKLKNRPSDLKLYRELMKRPLSKRYLFKKFPLLRNAYEHLLKKGFIYEETVTVTPPVKFEQMGVKTLKPFNQETFNSLEKTAPTQAKIYRFLSKNHKDVKKSDIYSQFGNVLSSLRSLEKKKLITFYRIPYTQEIPYLKKSKKKKPKLTKSQKSAFDRIKDAIKDNRYETFLIFGITGSGKTEVYLRATEEVLENGKSVIVLVPEIALTTQTIETFRSRFGDTAVIYHSRLGEKERIEVWKGIKNGKYRVIIGARFAIFAPAVDLGAVIVDEEHESTYKQTGKEPFYSARDIAVTRSRIENGVCILGSATPSLESFHNCTVGKYTLLELPERIDEKILPPVTIVDMRKEENRILSNLLVEKMKERIRKDEQTILFINRRGFSNYLVCRDCGFSPHCPFCDLTLTYHRINKTMKCHYCNYEETAPRLCPKCGSADFFYAGMGTQRIEQYLENLFPKLKVLRMDLDSMKRKWAHAKTFFQFREGEADLLLGTQMVAKGFDLPKVTLVGVISGDTVLNFPDFRAQERTFQLLTQVAGRTGRGILGGEVVIQTFAPDHYAIRESQLHNYRGFYDKEISIRKDLNYPPFSRLARIVLSSQDKKIALQRAEKLTRIIRASVKNHSFPIEILGPAPCPLSKLKGKFRFHILLKSKKPFVIQRVLAPLREKHSEKGLRISYDFDPLDMM